MLFAGYRRGDANDPDGYVASIAAVLSMYEPELIRRVTDPRTGISTTEKFMSFMPNSGELKVYCDQQAERDARLQQYRKLARVERMSLPRPSPQPGSRANLWVPANAPQYPTMIAKASSESADKLDYRYDIGGIWVTLSWIADLPMSDPSSNAMIERMAAE